MFNISLVSSSYLLSFSQCRIIGESAQPLLPLFLSLLAEEFMKHVVSYQDFAENPAVIEDPNLVVQIHKK